MYSYRQKTHVLSYVRFCAHDERWFPLTLHQHRSLIILGMADMLENKIVIILFKKVFHSISCMLIPDKKKKFKLHFVN